MRVCFICGSLEPGKDGVGDYTRRLACELIRNGNEVELVAINDRYVNQEWRGLQQDDGVPVTVNRLSYLTSWKHRFGQTKNIIVNCKPDWISLQFVPFTFQEKGLPIGLASKLKKLNDGTANWHVMFHELWVGMNKEAPFKLKLLGVVQKQIIKSFVHRLKAKVVHTHAKVYCLQLQKMGIPVKQLPLFTNLAVDDLAHASASLLKQDLGKEVIVFSLFGSIHPDAPVQDFAEELRIYSQEKGVKTKIKIIGKAGMEQEAWIKVLTTTGIDVEVLGELSINEVTQELCTSHYGVNTTPRLLAGKSSAIATMLGHWLPVICISKSWELPETVEEAWEGIVGYKQGNLATILQADLNKIKIHRLSEVSNQFLNDLSFVIQ